MEAEVVAVLDPPLARRQLRCLWATSAVLVAKGIADDVVRTVSENANALKFDHASFERD